MLTEFHIEYTTHNVYQMPVTEAIFEFIVSPCTDRTQQVTKLEFKNSLGDDIFYRNNPFGFQIACIRSTKSFKEFKFWMNATVEKVHQNPYAIDQLSLEDEQAILSSRDSYIEHHFFLEFSKYTTISPINADLILYKRTEQSVFEYLMQLNQYVYDMLEYDPEPTNVHTTTDEVIALKKGVCQDYAHLFLAIARKNHIPCRYVSGYLNQGENKLVGSAVMHAWAEAFIPGNGWHGFDPTNNLLADVNYIKAAHGTDYSDCSPIKGVLKTTGEQKTDYQVKVIPQLLESAQ